LEIQNVGGRHIEFDFFPAMHAVTNENNCIVFGSQIDITM